MGQAYAALTGQPLPSAVGPRGYFRQVGATHKLGLIPIGTCAICSRVQRAKGVGGLWILCKNSERWVCHACRKDNGLRINLVGCPLCSCQSVTWLKDGTYFCARCSREDVPPGQHGGQGQHALMAAMRAEDT